MNVRERDCRRSGLKVFRARDILEREIRSLEALLSCTNCLYVYSLTEDTMAPVCPVCGAISDD